MLWIFTRTVSMGRLFEHQEQNEPRNNRNFIRPLVKSV